LRSKQIGSDLKHSGNLFETETRFRFFFVAEEKLEVMFPYGVGDFA